MRRMATEHGQRERVDPVAPRVCGDTGRLLRNGHQLDLGRQRRSALRPLSVDLRGKEERYE